MKSAKRHSTKICRNLPADFFSADLDSLAAIAAAAAAQIGGRDSLGGGGLRTFRSGPCHDRHGGVSGYLGSLCEHRLKGGSLYVQKSRLS